jgi:hypothetical protein
MRIARKLTLLAMLAIAAAALTAPSAFAQTSTEPELHHSAPRVVVQSEVYAGGADINCPLVTPSPPASPPALPPLTAGGGCRTHVASAGTVTLSNHDAVGVEAVISGCTMEFDMRIDPAGEGYVTHQELTGGAGCTRKACGQVTPPISEGRIWSFWMQESEIAGNPARERVTFLFCLEPVGGGGASHCEFSVPMSQPTVHRYRFTASDAAGHVPAGSPRCEWDGIFDVEATPGTTGENLAEQNVEIRHT